MGVGSERQFCWRNGLVLAWDFSVFNLDSLVKPGEPMTNGIYFREFADGDFEIGILEGDWMHVGDFDYYMPWNRFENPFTLIGWL
jgi:hypothetical protein